MRVSKRHRAAVAQPRLAATMAPQPSIMSTFAPAPYARLNSVRHVTVDKNLFRALVAIITPVATQPRRRRHSTGTQAPHSLIWAP